MFFRRVDLFLTCCLVSLVCIITMIRYFSSSVDKGVGIDVFKTVVESFKYLPITMTSSGFWNFCRMYYFSFPLNFLYWSLDSLCLAVVPKTARKPPTSSLKFLIEYVYVGRLNRPPRPPRPWLHPLPERPPCLHLQTLLLSLDSLLETDARVISASLSSLLLLPAAGEAVSVSVIIVACICSKYC